MTRRYLNVSDTIAANEYKYHAKCGLHVNFWSFLLMSFCFMIEKVCKAKKEEFVLMATSIILNTSIIIVFRARSAKQICCTCSKMLVKEFIFYKIYGRWLAALLK